MSQISSLETTRRQRPNDAVLAITLEQAKARCFDACHPAQEARDYVFSDPRR